MIPDDRLRLVFTCCHPALAREAQVALTLRLVCGLTTAEIARAFLVSEPTMAARVTRAKKKISAARIAYRVPGEAELPDRLDAVLTVVHLLFTTGHTAPAGDGLVRADLVDRAHRPGPHAARADAGRARGPRAAGAAAADRRAPGHPHRRRRAAAAAGGPGPGRSGTGPRSTEGTALVLGALRGGCPGRFALQAAIAAVHAEAPSLRDDRLAAAAAASTTSCCGPGRRRWWR